MQIDSLLKLYQEYDSIPKSIRQSSFDDEDTKKAKLAFSANPSFDTLLKVFKTDLSMSNLIAEKLLAKLLIIQISQQNLSNVTLLDKPDIVSFEELKTGDIYVSGFEYYIYLTPTLSSDFDLTTLTMTESISMDVHISYELYHTNFILIGRVNHSQTKI